LDNWDKVENNTS